GSVHTALRHPRQAARFVLGYHSPEAAYLPVFFLNVKCLPPLDCLTQLGLPFSPDSRLHSWRALPAPKRFAPRSRRPTCTIFPSSSPAAQGSSATRDSTTRRWSFRVRSPSLPFYAATGPIAARGGGAW